MDSLIDGRAPNSYADQSDRFHLRRPPLFYALDPARGTRPQADNRESLTPLSTLTLRIYEPARNGGLFLVEGELWHTKDILDPLNVDKLWKGCHCVEEVSSENFATVTREAAGASKSISATDQIQVGVPYVTPSSRNGEMCKSNA